MAPETKDPMVVRDACPSHTGIATTSCIIASKVIATVVQKNMAVDAVDGQKDV